MLKLEPNLIVYFKILTFPRVLMHLVYICPCTMIQNLKKLETSNFVYGLVCIYILKVVLIKNTFC